MTENRRLELRASSMGHGDQLNHTETSPPPVLSDTLTQVRDRKREHQGTPWRKSVQRATVNAGVNNGEGRPSSQAAQSRQRDGDKGTQMWMDKVGFSSTRKFETLLSSSAAA